MVEKNINSDNGTIFFVADREYNQFLEDWNPLQIYDFLSSQKAIQWHFNPPVSPRFGGIWEG